MAITYPRHLTAAKCIKTKKDVSNFDITPLNPYYSTTLDIYKPFYLLTEIGLYDNVVQTSEKDMEKTIQFKIPAGWRKPKTGYIDPYWAKRLEELIEERLDKKDRAGHQVLVDRLLSLGGSGVAILFEEDLEKLLSRGTVCKGTKSRMKKGKPCRCHQNSAALWRENKDRIRIVTGWALSRDGIWRQHSWAVDLLVNWDSSGYQIIETTERRLVYYGFVMDSDECHEFDIKNCGF